MKDSLLRLYHLSPYPLRVLAASVQGYYLRHWRYGPETEQLAAEALERETWSPARWQAWQQARLAKILQRAATRVPYYREHWAARRRRGDRASWEYLENWPILEKEEVRANARAFVAADCQIHRMMHEHTSGSTGKPLDLWWSRETVKAWYALFEARWRRWYGVSRQDRWAILGGQLVAPVQTRRPPFWVWNAALQQLYMSSYHLAPDLLPHYLKALRDYRITYLWGYTSALVALAQAALEAKQGDWSLRVVITNAEPLFAYQRELLEQAFGCPVRETYGMSEIVAAAGECQHGRLHVWPEAGMLELLDNGQPVAAGASGDLICTGLLNTDMPLIRYRVGDRATWPAVLEPCPCGRTLPILASVDGRCDDVLYTKDGRQVGRLDPVFKANLPIREAQIIQESLDVIRVRYVPARGFSQADGEDIARRLQDRLGNVEVILEPVLEIPRSANGKFRAVVCQIAPYNLKQW